MSQDRYGEVPAFIASADSRETADPFQPGEVCPTCNQKFPGQKMAFTLRVPKKEPELAAQYELALHRAEHIMSGDDFDGRSPIYTVVQALQYFNLNESF